MKPIKTLLISSVVFFSILLNAQAQQLHKSGVIPLENYDEFIQSHENVPENTYFKDVNHLLGKYVGTWEGTYNNKTYIFVINKKLGIHGKARESLKYDKLFMRYKITDNAGHVMADILDTDQNGALEGFGMNRVDNSWYEILYTGEDDQKVHCGDSGMLYLKCISANQIEIFVDPHNVFVEKGDCPNGYQAPPFPKYTDSHLILTKTGPAPNLPRFQLNPEYQ